MKKGGKYQLNILGIILIIKSVRSQKNNSAEVASRAKETVLNSALPFGRKKHIFPW